MVQEFTGRMDLNHVDKWKFAIGINKVIAGVNDIDFDSLDDKVGILVEGIRNTYNSARLRRNWKKKNTSWWNGKLEIERKRIRALRRKFQSETDNEKREDLKVMYKRGTAVYKRLVLTTKRTVFKEFLNGVTKSQTFGSSYKIIKDKYKVNVLSHMILKEDGSTRRTLMNHEGGSY